MKFIYLYQDHDNLINTGISQLPNVILCKNEKNNGKFAHFNYSSYDHKVEYISTNSSVVNAGASTQYQYIDLGLKATPYTTCEIKFMFTDNDAQRGLIGGGSSNGLVYSVYINGNKYLATAFANNTGDWVSTNVSPSLSTPQIIKINSSDLKVYVNGTAKNTRSTRPTLNSAYNLRLMTNHSLNNQFIGRIYYCKIWQNEVLVRDLIPVRKNGDGCLFDLITEQLFKNAQTGTLTYGPDIT